MVDDSHNTKPEGSAMIYDEGGIFINAMEFERGQRIGKHCHDYDHFSVLVSGRVELETMVPGEVPVRRIITGLAVLHIKAGVLHTITSKSAKVVWYCIHNSDRARASLSDRGLWPEAADRG